MSGAEGTGGDDLSGYDAVIAACRPVEWTEEFQIPDLEPTPIYPGSIVVECQGCGRAIYVGPRAQALEIPHYLVSSCVRRSPRSATRSTRTSATSATPTCRDERGLGARR